MMGYRRMAIRAGKPPEPTLRSAPPRGARVRTRETAPAGRQGAEAGLAAVGNQAARRVLRQLGVQAKFAVSQPHDPAEIEADRVAQTVMAMDGGGGRPRVSQARSPRGVQRMCQGCEEEEERLQRAALPGHTVDGDPSVAARLATSLTGGQPLPAAARRFFEPRFGRDFSGVRVHSDGSGAALASDVAARAFTLGRDIVFGSAQYSPDSPGGRRLLAHELAHVAQQGATGTDRASSSSPMVQRQPEDEVPPPPGLGPPPIPTTPPPTATVPINEPPEPGCPRTGTNIGNVTPHPPCDPPTAEEIAGDASFRFCSDSDVFSDPAARTSVRSLAGGAHSLSTFVVHAFASVEGPGTADQSREYNARLSCHRAKRVARELVNAGVREDRITIVAKGPTERFGTGRANRPLNRVVLVGVQHPQRPAPNLPPNATSRQIADAAQARLGGGHYNLGADAYLARWTCGRFRSLADAVRQVTVLVEGVDGPALTRRPGPPDACLPPPHEGTLSFLGLNTIVLSTDVFRANDPLECATNRIADLTFHQMVRPQIGAWAEQHAGGLHMAHLAGFGRCQTDPPCPQEFSVPRPADPKAGLQPPCADQPLPGPIGTRRTPSRAPVAFTVVNFTPATSSMPLTMSRTGPPSNNLISMDSPGPSVDVNADVSASGPASEVANYDVGFVQTVQSDDNVHHYVGGQRIRWVLPVPLRDGPRQDNPLHDPPWFHRPAHAQAQVSPVHVELLDAPALIMSMLFLDMARTRFFGPFGPPCRPLQPGDTMDFTLSMYCPRFDGNNVLDEGHRTLLLNTWLVARRRDAPLSRFSTEFLQGSIFSAQEDVEFVARGNTPSATGTVNVTHTPATAADAAGVQLRGATPADFFSPPPFRVPLFNQFIRADGALPRTQAGGLAPPQFFAEVNTIAEPFRRAMGLTGPLQATVRVDLTTGRLPLDDSQLTNGTIQIASRSGTAITPTQATALARSMFPEVRKLTIGVGGSLTANLTGIFPVPIVLRQLP